MSLIPTHADLGIEIGKAQAMAGAAQTTAERMEANLNDRMDRIDKAMADGFKEIKDLITGIHADITDLRVEGGKHEAKEEIKKHGWSVGLSLLAIIISSLSIFGGALKAFFVAHR